MLSFCTRLNQWHTHSAYPHVFFRVEGWKDMLYGGIIVDGVTKQCSGHQ